MEKLKDVTPKIAGPQSQPIVGSARLISAALRQMASRARVKKRVWVTNYPAGRRWEGSFHKYIFIAFIIVVAVPVLSAGLYLAAFISNQYTSEMRFAVRGAERSSFDPLTTLMGIPSTGKIQEALIISEYIKGRGIVEELEKTIDLRSKFIKSGVDPISRFRSDAPIEDLVKYWWWHVDVNISALSGIIEVIVYAFSPDDALQISRAILAASERLVNEMSDRARRDAVSQTQIELKRAEDNLQNKIRAMQDLRNAEGLLDAEKTSEVMLTMLAELRLELIRMDREYSAQRQAISADSPQLRVLESRINSTREQIGQLENQMTGTRSQKAGSALAESMGRFERLKLEHELAQKRYIAAAASFEKARVDSATQQVYLTTFVPPTLAQEALYPRRMWLFTIILLGCLMVWGMGTGAAVLIRNNMA
jgi:capsular polysaccharide transport system permease protein